MTITITITLTLTLTITITITFPFLNNLPKTKNSAKSISIENKLLNGIHNIF